MSDHSKRLRPWAGRAVTAALLLAGASASAQTHLENPFLGARPYVNPDYTAQAETSAAATADPALRAAMRQVGATPTAVWLDTIAQVPEMTTHLDRALAAGQDLVIFVLHDIPGRGCGGLELTELPLAVDGLATYRSQFIDAAAAIAGQPRYAGIRIVFVVEPGALASLVTSLSVPCLAGQGPAIYAQAVQYAVDTLHAIPNAYVYLDLAHAAWLGWSANATAMVSLLDRVSSGFAAGKGAVDGFVTNAGEYVPTEEPYLVATRTVGGRQVLSSSFYEYNAMLDDAAYAADMYARLTAAGWPTSIGMLSDTSRNGWGGPSRPTGPSAEAVDLERYVRDSKVDRRARRTLWCNPAGAGIGQRPQAAPAAFPAAHYDAYVWLRSPGQSDGASLNVYDGPWYNQMCDPSYTTPEGVPTGALPDAPPAGRWFPAQFAQLVQNAWPPIVAPAAVTLSVVRAGLGSGTVATTPAGILCGATCSASFAAGSTVTVTAVPAAGSVFAGWSGDCAGSRSTCVLVMDGDRAATASFGGPNPTLTVTKAGAGGGQVTSTPTGINACTSTCSASFIPRTTVTLTATAPAGARFAGWSGACSGAVPSCTVTMPENEDVSVTATFDAAPTTPCQDPITFTYNTGNFNGTRAACYRTALRVNGWGCANFQGRTVSVNGGPPVSTCGAGPFPLARAADGYTYFSATAGTYPWASIYAW